MYLGRSSGRGGWSLGYGLKTIFSTDINKLLAYYADDSGGKISGGKASGLCCTQRNVLRSLLRNTLHSILRLMEKHIRKVTRVGKRSLSVVIPADIVRELGIRERQKLVVRRSGQKIIIEDWKE